MINLMLALVFIAVLCLSAFSIYFVKDYKTNKILTATETDYNLVTYVNSETLNLTNFEDMFDNDVFYNEADNDTAYIDLTGGAMYHSQTYGNDVITVSNNNTVIANYTCENDEANLIFHALDMTTHELAEIDFLKIECNWEHSGVNIAWNEGGDYDNVGSSEVVNNTYILPIDLSLKQDLLSSADSQIYLFSSILDETDTTYIFNIKACELSNSYYSYDDRTVFIIILVVSDIIFGFTLAFATDTLDIKLDYKRKDNR